MDLDPTVQVALISVFTTLIVTAGVVITAIINNRRERANAATAGVEAGLDEKEVLGRMLSLIDENVRKEAEILQLKNRLKTAHATNADLRARLDAKGDTP